jgi:Protein of unknown function (DUF3604)
VNIRRGFCVILLLAIAPAYAGKELLWGDTHVHTYYSTDSLINQNFSIGPAEAYRYAMGGPVRNPLTDTRVQIQTPLDFLVVADHAEAYGVMRRALANGLPRDDLGLFDRLQSWFMEQMFIQLSKRPDSVVDLLEYASADTLDVREAAKTPASINTPNQELIARDTWNTATRLADQFNVPGRFTALIGWEWSSIPAGSNLHRVVFTDADAPVAQQWVPFSSSESSYPEDLWSWLDETSQRTGADFVAIPHNSNISRGFMFPDDLTLRGEPITEQWLQARARWEIAVEATQVKGDSETDPAVSPDDPFADFESYPHYISPQPIPWDPGAGDFVRSALIRGLQMEQRHGVNPYRFGVIGSTDSHTGLATAEEGNFWGKFLTDSFYSGKVKEISNIETFGWAMSASGLAAVWAEENTRESIYAAFKRREIYATTGPRIAVRLYAGTDYNAADEVSLDIEAISARGVPMGGGLTSLVEPPTFYIQAARDPESATLDRIQLIKGWLENGEPRERVYNVAWSGDRELTAEGKLPPVPDTVDVKTGIYSNEHGAGILTKVWVDPDFNPDQPALYYVRVLEVPTPRHSTLDAIALDMDVAGTNHPVSIQERAYTSAIHYSP